MQIWKPVLWTVGVLGALAALVGAAVVVGGAYNVAATEQHTQPMYTLLETAMHSAVRRRARDVVVPPGLDAPERVLRGAACYRDRCVQCHGGPGVASDAIGMAMQPVPGSLIGAARVWRASELYWITRHGIKMSGMPAWQQHLSEAELWAVVAFVQRLPALTPSAYGELVQQASTCGEAEPAAAPGTAPAAPATPTDRIERGRLALRLYGCHACHSIPGVSGPQPQVGPPLAGFAKRSLIAGRLANTPANLVAWIRDPKRFDPRTAMPDQSVTEAHAADMAAYLSTLQ